MGEVVTVIDPLSRIGAFGVKPPPIDLIRALTYLFKLRDFVYVFMCEQRRNTVVCGKVSDDLGHLRFSSRCRARCFRV